MQNPFLWRVFVVEVVAAAVHRSRRGRCSHLLATRWRTRPQQKKNAQLLILLEIGFSLRVAFQKQY